LLFTSDLGDRGMFIDLFDVMLRLEYEESADDT
jgi:hypothetical protein